MLSSDKRNKLQKAFIYLLLMQNTVLAKENQISVITTTYYY